jgi:hypothetical protein
MMKIDNQSIRYAGSWFSKKKAKPVEEMDELDCYIAQRDAQEAQRRREVKAIQDEVKRNANAPRDTSHQEWLDKAFDSKRARREMKWNSINPFKWLHF